MMSERYSAQIDAILASSKYRGLGIPRGTVAALFEQEAGRHKEEKALVQAVREKLHNVMAVYLGDPDYALAQAALDQAFQQGSSAVQQTCRAILASHISTRERLPHLDNYYPPIFAITGPPASVHDLACGLHPFCFPWMGLAPDVRYHAYDIHAPRVALINYFLQLCGLPTLAEVRDILIEPPREMADVAFFLKEAHRLEQRQTGANRLLWPSVACRWLVVSLPSQNMTGRHSLRDKHRRLVEKTVSGYNWLVEELDYPDELIYCIRKE